MDFSLFKGNDLVAAKQLYDGFMSYEPSFHLKVSANVTSVFNRLMDQNPEIIHVNSLSRIDGFLGCTITPICHYTPVQARQYLAECEQEAEYMVEKVKRARMSNYDAAVYVHDYFTRRVKYQALNSTEDHSIVGTFINFRGCCESISKSYKFVLDRLGIPCLCVAGTASGGTSAIISGPHLWNMICIDGEWCHVDVTYDLVCPQIMLASHAYFGLTDMEISVNHTVKEKIYPDALSDGLSYFGRKHRRITNQEECTEYILSYINDSKLCFELMFDESFRGDIQNAVVSGCQSAMRKAEMTGQFIYASDKARKHYLVKIDKG